MKMQNVEMEFVTFDAQDVIATSVPSGGRTVAFANFYDGNNSNGTIIGSDGTVIYDSANNIKQGYVARLNEFFGTTSITTNSYVINGATKLYQIVQADGAPAPSYAEMYNHVFKWVEENSRFELQ